MKLEQAMKAFDGKQSLVADALGIRVQNLREWAGVVPSKHRATLVVASDGKIKASADDIAEWQEQIELLQTAIRLSRKGR